MSLAPKAKNQGDEYCANGNDDTHFSYYYLF